MDTPAILAGRAPASARPAGLSLLSDERLARLAGGSGERAFAGIYQRYHQPLYRYCRSILHNDAEAEDALQSTLASALAALRRGQRDAPLRPWLFRIAHNESISVIRRRTPTGGEEEAPQLVAPSAEEQAGQRERIASLVADLRELPERQRGALLMRELSGLSHEEIAVALDLSQGAAKQAIFEARASLAEFEEGRAMPCEDLRRAISDGDRRALRSRRIRAHLRGCAGCTTFAEAIGDRRTQLQALAPPLPPALAAAVLARVIGSAPGHAATAGALATGAGSAATGANGVAASGAGGLAAGLAGKGAGTGASLIVKGLLGAAVVATAATGVTGALKIASPGSSTRSTSPSHHAVGAGADNGVGSAPAASSATGGAATRSRGVNGAAGAHRRHGAASHDHAHAQWRSLGASPLHAHLQKPHPAHPSRGKGSDQSSNSTHAAAERVRRSREPSNSATPAHEREPAPANGTSGSPEASNGHTPAKTGSAKTGGETLAVQAPASAESP